MWAGRDQSVKGVTGFRQKSRSNALAMLQRATAGQLCGEGGGGGREFGTTVYGQVGSLSTPAGSH